MAKKSIFFSLLFDRPLRKELFFAATRCSLKQGYFLFQQSSVFLLNPGPAAASVLDSNLIKIRNFFYPLSILIWVILGDPEVTANLYRNFAYPNWEGYVICSIYLR